MKKQNKIAFYDIDGTLLNSAHRYKLAACGSKIDLKHWKENSTPEQIQADQPILAMVAKFKRDMQDPETITAISTNRYFCQDTKAVFDRLGLQPDFISARESDQQSGADLKQNFIRDLMLELNIIKAVFYDDNFKILKEVKQALGNKIRVIYQPSKQGT